MKCLLTICCAEKDKTKGKIPAIDRYLSSRIQSVYEKALSKKVPMLIFSGKFGFISPNEKIPWYDKLLKMEEVESLLPFFVRTLKRHNIYEMIAYMKPRNKEGWEAYYKAIESCCETLGIKLSISIIK